MLNLECLIQDLTRILNQFSESVRLERLDADFIRTKIFQIDFKLGKKNCSDFFLSFQDKSLVDWLPHLDQLGEKIIDETRPSPEYPKLQTYQLLSFNNRTRSVLTFNFNRKDFLISIFKTELNLSSIRSRRSNSLLKTLSGEHRCCVISVLNDNEWLQMRTKFQADCLVNTLSSLISTTDRISLSLDELEKLNRSYGLEDQKSIDLEKRQSPDEELVQLTEQRSEFTPQLDKYEKVYLIIPESTKLAHLDNLIRNENLRLVRIGRVICNWNYSTYRTKLKEELRDEFDDDVIDEFIKMKLLSYVPDHTIKLDLNCKQIVFLHYNHARVHTLIAKCYKLFNSKFEIKDDFLSDLDGHAKQIDELDPSSTGEQTTQSTSSTSQLDQARNQSSISTSQLDQPRNQSINLLVNELNDYTFIDHFIGLVSFVHRLELDKLDKIELVSSKVINLLVHLCNDLSKYYQKKKVLAYSSCSDLVCFKVNLLRSVLSLMNVYFSLCDVEPMESI